MRTFALSHHCDSISFTSLSFGVWIASISDKRGKRYCCTWLRTMGSREGRVSNVDLIECTIENTCERLEGLIDQIHKKNKKILIPYTPTNTLVSLDATDLSFSCFNWPFTWATDNAGHYPEGSVPITLAIAPSLHQRREWEAKLGQRWFEPVQYYYRKLEEYSIQVASFRTSCEQQVGPQLDATG